MKQLIFLVLASILMLNGCQQENTESEEKLIRPVKYMVLTDANEADQREFPGILQAANRVDLAFQVSGKLIKLPIKEGQKVKKGDLIGQLDQRDYKARYDSAQADFKNARADLKRAEKLIKKQFISQSDFDKINAKTEMANANVRLAKKALEDTILVAPFTGTIAKQFIQNFTDVQAKQAILSFQNNEELEVVVSIPEYIMINKDQAKVIKDLKIYAVFNRFPNEKFPLKLNEYTTEADASTRTYKVTLGIIDKKGFNLYPGMTANVFASQKSLDYLNLVPVNAVFADPKGSKIQYVWVIGENNKVHLQEVKIGQLKRDQIEVISGIQKNDKIVTAGVHHLTENQVVKLLEPTNR